MQTKRQTGRENPQNKMGDKRVREETDNINQESIIGEKTVLDRNVTSKTKQVSSQVAVNVRIPGYTQNRLYKLMGLCSNAIEMAFHCPRLPTSTFSSQSHTMALPHGHGTDGSNIANLSNSLILNNLTIGLSQRDLSFMPYCPSSLLTHHTDIDTYFVENPHHILFLQNPAHVSLYKRLKSGVLVASSLGHRSSHAVWGPQYSGKRLLLSTLATSLRLVVCNRVSDSTTPILPINDSNNTKLNDGRRQGHVTGGSSHIRHLLVLHLDGDILRDDNDAVRGIVSDIRDFLEVGYIHDSSFFLDSSNSKSTNKMNDDILTVEDFIVSTVRACSNSKFLLTAKARADYLQALAKEGCPLSAQSQAVRQLRMRHKGLLGLGWKPTLKALVQLGHDYRRRSGGEGAVRYNCTIPPREGTKCSDYSDVPSKEELEVDKAVTRALQRQELFPGIQAKIMSDISKCDSNVSIAPMYDNKTGAGEFDLAEGLQYEDDERQAAQRSFGIDLSEDGDSDESNNHPNDEDTDAEKPIPNLLPQNKSINASATAASGGSASSIGESLSGLMNALLYFNHIGIHIAILVNSMPTFGQRCDRVTYILSGLMNEAPPSDADYSVEPDLTTSTGTSTGGISFIVTSRTPDISLEKRLSSRLACEMLMCPLLVVRPSETVMMLFDPVAIPDELTLSPSYLEYKNQQQQKGMVMMLSQRQLPGNIHHSRPLFEKNKNCTETLLSSGNIIATLHLSLFHQESVFIHNFKLLDKKLQSDTKAKQTKGIRALGKISENEEIQQNNKNYSNIYDIFRGDELLSVLYSDVKKTNICNKDYISSTQDAGDTTLRLTQRWIIRQRRLLRSLIRKMNETRRLLSMAELIGTAIHPKKAQEKVQQLNHIIGLNQSNGAHTCDNHNNIVGLQVGPSAKSQLVIPEVENPDIVENQLDFHFLGGNITNNDGFPSTISWKYKPHVQSVHATLRPFLLSLQSTNLFLEMTGTDVLASKWVMTEVISGRMGLAVCLGAVIDHTTGIPVSIGGDTSAGHKPLPPPSHSPYNLSSKVLPSSFFESRGGERERLLRLFSLKDRAQSLCNMETTTSSHIISHRNTGNDVPLPPPFPPTAHHSQLDGLERCAFVKSGYFSREHFILLTMLYVRLDAGQKRTFIELMEDIGNSFIPQLMSIKIKNTITSSDDNNNLAARATNGLPSYQNKPLLRATKIQDALMEAFMELLDWGLICITSSAGVGKRKGMSGVTSLSNSALYGGDIGISGGMWRIHAFLRQILSDPKLSEMVGVDEQQRVQISNLVR